MDKKDPLSIYRKEFNIPFFQNKESVYFTGHSLGLQPKAYNKYLNQEIDDWKKLRKKYFFEADWKKICKCEWMKLTSDVNSQMKWRDRLYKESLKN